MPSRERERPAGPHQDPFSTINDAIFGLENIVTVYLAALLALDDQLTVGMIFAFMAYKQHFTDKAVAAGREGAATSACSELHLERLSDIALTPLEPGHDQPAGYARPIRGSIELRNVCFRYAETEPFVLENINLTVEAGAVRHHHGAVGRRQDDAGEDHARAARADQRRGADRRRAADDHRRAGLPRAGRRR